MCGSQGHASILPRRCDKAAASLAGTKILDIERVFHKHVYGYAPVSNVCSCTL